MSVLCAGAVQDSQEAESGGEEADGKGTRWVVSVISSWAAGFFNTTLH